jgi:hypothetical protein
MPGSRGVQPDMDEDGREAVRAEGLDPDEPAIIRAWLKRRSAVAWGAVKGQSVRVGTWLKRLVVSKECFGESVPGSEQHSNFAKRGYVEMYCYMRGGRITHRTAPRDVWTGAPDHKDTGRIRMWWTPVHVVA